MDINFAWVSFVVMMIYAAELIVRSLCQPNYLHGGWVYRYIPLPGFFFILDAIATGTMVFDCMPLWKDEAPPRVGKGLPPLPEDRAPSASLKAQAAAMHPRAPPVQLRGLPWPRSRASERSLARLPTFRRPQAKQFYDAASISLDAAEGEVEIDTSSLATGSRVGRILRLIRVVRVVKIISMLGKRNKDKARPAPLPPPARPTATA